jgi:carboxymethylenebutenolidase
MPRARRRDKARVPHEATVYPGAPHSFFDRRYAEFGAASADAWQRTRDFVARNSKK